MLRIKKNDLVEVIAGNDKGKRGRIIRVIPEDNKVLVQGLNLRYKHVRRTQQNPQGGRIRREFPMHISNVALVDPSSDTPTRFGVKVENGKKVRYAKKSGEVIDKA